jgi:hypothetical protein
VTTNDTLSNSELSAARHCVKSWLEYKFIPFLPEEIETQYFMSGRKIWSFRYANLVVRQSKKSKKVSFQIDVTLRKELRIHLNEYSFGFDATSVFSHKKQSWSVGQIKQVSGSVLKKHDYSEV